MQMDSPHKGTLMPVVLPHRRPVMPVGPYSKIHATNMGPTWVLSAPEGPHGGPMNLVIREPNKLQQFGSPIYIHRSMVSTPCVLTSLWGYVFPPLE